MQLRRLLFGTLIALVAAGLAYTFAHAHFFEGLFGAAEYRLVDWRMRGAATDPPRDKSDVVLVLFDSSSVKDWPYLTPFPRPVLAELVNAVAATGARAIGLDVYLEHRARAIDAAMHMPGDSLLKAAIANAGNVVMAAPTYQDNGGRSFRPPDPYFTADARAVGSADTPSPFEVFRDIELTVRTDKGLIPGFALALYAGARGLDLDSLMQATQQKGYLDIPGLPMRYARLPPPGVAVQTMPILYVGPPSSPDREDGGFVALPSGLVQATWDQPEPMRSIGVNALAGQLRGKVVMLGSGFHAEERYRTPFYDATNDKGDIYGWMYGTEVVATALHDLLTGQMVVPLTHAQIALLLLVMAGLITLAVFWRGVTFGAVVGAAVVAAELVVAWFAFGTSHVHIPMVGPSIAGVFAFIGATSYTSIVEGKEKRVIRGAFSKYLSPVVVDELVADPSRLKLGGEKREISVLFSDLAGFTTLSETMDPAELLALLNRYLD
ncbi:MAG TPA: CHASE2 domain-containing protein, partial [Longimicrobiales bacterium]|nr:CHASE2 domain-containing protein [Longimicrobiales bacterium]